MTSIVTIRLCAPMQAWGRTPIGTEHRDTASIPTKSGVIGMICSAMGIDRSDTNGIKQIANAPMATRVDHPGNQETDYQLINNAVNPAGKTPRTLTSKRQYLADACFTIFLSYEDSSTAEEVHNGLKDPVRPLSAGRRSFAIPGVPDMLIYRDRNDIDQIIATHPSCRYHQLPDTVTVIKETTLPLGTIGVEQHDDQPLDYTSKKRHYTTRRTHTTTVTTTPTSPTTGISYTIDANLTVLTTNQTKPNHE